MAKNNAKKVLKKKKSPANAKKDFINMFDTDELKCTLYAAAAGAAIAYLIPLPDSALIAGAAIGGGSYLLSTVIKQYM